MSPPKVRSGAGLGWAEHVGIGPKRDNRSLLYLSREAVLHKNSVAGPSQGKSSLHHGSRVPGTRFHQGLLRFGRVGSPSNPVLKNGWSKQKSVIFVAF
jgi:hypothetical protein